MAEFISAVLALSMASYEACVTISKAIESIKDVTPGIEHWNIQITLLEIHLQTTNQRLEKAEKRGLTDEILGRQLSDALDRFFKSFQYDLKAMKDKLPNADLSRIETRRWFPRATAKSLQAFKNMLNDDQALRTRISEKTNLLQLSIQAISLLDPFPDIEIRPREIVDGLNNSHFSVEEDTSLSPCVRSIGDIARSVAVRDARGLDDDPTDFETSTMRTSSDWQFVSDDPDEPTPEELESEFDVAKKLGARLCDAEMPTLALDLHLDAVNLALELERRNIRSFRLEDHISLKARYVETLISCERHEKLKEGYHAKALKQLNEMVENIWNASSEENVLATCRMWIKAEDLAHRLDDVELSIKCLRKVFNYHFNSENIDASALIPILQLLCRRYEAIGKWGKSESLRKMVHTKLGSDPTTAEVMRLEEAKAWCLDKGFEVEVINQELWFDKRVNAKGNRPLHEAAMNHDMNLDILRTLMRSEEYMLTDDYGDTALLAAVDLSNYNVTEVLLGDSRLAHIRARDSQTSLHRCQDENVMRLLIKAVKRRNSSTANSALDPIDINSRDNFDRAPLHLACTRDNVGVVQALLEGDADVNAICHSGETPLLAACFSATPRRDLVPIVRLLVSHGADIEVKDKSNRDVRVALKRRGFSKKETMDILARNGP